MSMTMETEMDLWKLQLEAAVKAVKDQINAFDTFTRDNPQLTVLILNLKAIIGNQIEWNESTQIETDVMSASGTSPKKEFREIIVPLICYSESAADKGIKKLQDTLGAVEIQICAFKYFSSNNLRLAVLCKNIQDILESVKQVKLEPETDTEADTELLKFKVLTKAEAIRASSALVLGFGAYLKNEEAETPVGEIVEESKIVKEEIAERALSEAVDGGDGKIEEIVDASTFKRKRGRPPGKRRSARTKNLQTESPKEEPVPIKFEKCSRSPEKETRSVTVTPGSPNYKSVISDAKENKEHKPVLNVSTNVNPPCSSSDESNTKNSEPASDDMVTLLRQFLTEERYEMNLIEQVFRDPDKIKELGNSLKNDIAGLVLASESTAVPVVSTPSTELKICAIAAATTATATNGHMFSPKIEASEIVNKNTVDKSVNNSITILPEESIKSVDSSQNAISGPRDSKSSHRDNKFDGEKIVEINVNSGSTRISRFSSMSKTPNSPKELKQLFVKMTEPLSDFELLVFFAQFGLVVKVQSHLYSVPSWNSAGYCFVTFDSIETVQELLRNPDRDIFGKRVRLSKVKGKDHTKYYSSRQSVQTPHRSSTANWIGSPTSDTEFDSGSGQEYSRRSRSSPRNCQQHHNRVQRIRQHPYKLSLRSTPRFGKEHDEDIDKFRNHGEVSSAPNRFDSRSRKN